MDINPHTLDPFKARRRCEILELMVVNCFMCFLGPDLWMYEEQQTPVSHFFRHLTIRHKQMKVICATNKLDKER